VREQAGASGQVRERCDGQLALIRSFGPDRRGAEDEGEPEDGGDRVDPPRDGRRRRERRQMQLEAHATAQLGPGRRPAVREVRSSDDGEERHLARCGK